MSRSAALAAWTSALERYRHAQPAQEDLVRQFLELALAGADAFRREHAGAHFTGSAWLVDHTGRRALLTHHRKLGRWLQPGGHADGELDLAEVALREAVEESGISGLRGERELFDLDRHWIPAHGAESGHWHYDARFVVRAGPDDRFVVGDESHALAWRPIAELPHAAELDPSLQRMARKWLDREPTGSRSRR